LNLVQRISNASKQQLTLIAADGTLISFYLYYAPTQQAWFCDINDGSFVVDGLQIMVSPNMLHQWKNILTYGIMVYSSDGYEAQNIDDFQQGRIQLYLLSADEVASVEASQFA
jgi:hypothetical protein